MKKLIYGSLFLALVGIGFIGCKKQNPIADQKESNLKSITVETIGGLEKVGSILKFETIEDYVTFVEDSLETKWEKLDAFTSEQGFQNYFVQNPLSSDDSDSLAMEEMFGKLLNGDGVIIIGEYAIKIDLPKQSAFVTKKVNLTANYNDLITGKTSNKDVKAFSTNDDVIDILLDGLTFKCGGSQGFNELSEIFGPEGFDLYGGEMVTFRARYFKSGIYFAVRIKGYQHPNDLGLYGSTPKLQFEIQSDNPNWKAMRMRPRPCSNNNNVYHTGGLRDFNGSGVWSSDQLGRYQVWKGYERVRGLNGYRIWIRGYINDQLSSTTWIGREVNSNF